MMHLPGGFSPTFSSPAERRRTAGFRTSTPAPLTAGLSGCARDQNDVTTEVRDTFWLIDEDRWTNETFLSVDGGPWQKISSGVYTRVES